MIGIKEIVKKALRNGCLSIQAEKQIRSLLQTNYDSEDIDALIILERSMVEGKVTQESVPQTDYYSSKIKLAYQATAEMACVTAMALSRGC